MKNDFNITLKSHIIQNLHEKSIHEHLIFNQKPGQARDIPWDEFYKTNASNFFKDRHYLLDEFTCLKDALETGCTIHLLEVGCGCANTVLPLLLEYQNLFVHAIDMSATAVEIVNNLSKEKGLTKRLTASICDISKQTDIDALIDEVKIIKFDFVACIFVFSALMPCKMDVVLKRLKELSKNGGYFLFRDYAFLDHAELRFCPTHRVGLQHFIREDMTTSFFFSKLGLEMLFKNGSFQKSWLNYTEKIVKNNSTDQIMKRKFLTGVFKVLET